MLELSPILLSALTGFISGLLLSMPVGPVNLTIINVAPGLTCKIGNEAAELAALTVIPDIAANR